MTTTGDVVVCPECGHVFKVIDPDWEPGDPSKVGWLSDICSMPAETKVTCSGYRKLPGRPPEFADGEGNYHSRLSATKGGYQDFTEALIGIRLDPCRMWFEMGHDVECNDE
jgi:hypothetical protein